MYRDLIPQNANTAQRDGFPVTGTISIGPYTALVFSQDGPS
jgi:hypothetical protein